MCFKVAELKQKGKIAEANRMKATFDAATAAEASTTVPTVSESETKKRQAEQRRREQLELNRPKRVLSPSQQTAAQIAAATAETTRGFTALPSAMYSLDGIRFVASA